MPKPEAEKIPVTLVRVVCLSVGCLVDIYLRSSGLFDGMLMYMCR